MKQGYSMAILRVPSLQHLARNWRSDPQHICHLLVTLANNSPTFSYDPLYGAVRDMLVFNTPYDQIVEGMKRIRRPDVRDNLLGVLPLIRDHFKGISPTFVQAVARRYYPVGRALMVPFEPPLVYGALGGLHFPWFSFWRSNPLAQERLSLFVTIVKDVLLQDPDLEAAEFLILDFSAPEPKQDRVLDVIDARDIPRVSDKTKIEMLSVFSEGFRLAQADLAKQPDRERERDGKEAEERGSADQPSLFDPKV
jgi:hypothetical protein